MKPRSPHYELLPAKHYYGEYSTGWVVLCDGFPKHFTGPTARKDAMSFLDTHSQNAPMGAEEAA